MVFGNDCDQTGKTGNKEKTKREIKIRERMVVKNETRKLVVSALKCKTEFRSSSLGLFEISLEFSDVSKPMQSPLNLRALDRVAVGKLFQSNLLKTGAL